MDRKEDILVSVICITYNQEKYIGQCLESMLCQKTNFKYEIIVHDDASTDRTREIIREYELRYPDIIKPIYQEENKYSQDIWVTDCALEKASGKYLAFCEGDDYWCDENKLQLQFDFMEANEAFSLCFHRTATFYEYQNRLDDNWFFWKDKAYKGGGEYTQEELIKLNTVPVSSQFYRKSDYATQNMFEDKIIYGDMCATLFCATRGKGFCIDKVMSVYRRNVDMSAMTKTYNSVEKYNKGIEGTIVIFESIDKLSNNNFHAVFDELIIQEQNKLIKFNKEEVIKGVQNSDFVCIYGTGAYGEICLGELHELGIEAHAFVVSDSQGKETFKGIKVLPVSELINLTNPYVLISAGKKAREQMLEMLKHLKINSYCVSLDEVLQ